MSVSKKFDNPVTHYFVTNRFIDHNGRVNEDGKKPAQDDLRFGKYTFDSPSDKGIYELLDEPRDTDEMFEKREETPLRTSLPSEMMFTDLHGDMKRAQKGESDVLVVVHGYNNTFQDSLDMIRTMHERYVLNDESPIQKIVAYSWPSNGKLTEYREDAEDATDSGRTLGRLYLKLIWWFKRMYKDTQFEECEQNIHVFVHSLGNLVLESMIGTLARKGVSPRSLFKEVICTGSDIDYDVFDIDKPLYNLIDYCDRVHVYFHRKDRALSISESTKNALNRLGKWGFKNTSRLPDGVYQCDVTDTDDDMGNLKEKKLNHWYYYTSSEVVEDISAILNGSSSLFYA